jgi:5-bromo-4-chloroindolyl phosphate hydrolysis protein
VSKKSKGINPDLEKAISDLLKQVMADPTATLTDKTKVIDRALNLEKVKQKISDDEWGSGFLADEEESG